MEDVLDVARGRVAHFQHFEGFRSLVEMIYADDADSIGCYETHAAIIGLLSDPAPSAVLFVDERTIRMLLDYTDLAATRIHREYECADYAKALSKYLSSLLERWGLADTAEEDLPTCHRALEDPEATICRRHRSEPRPPMPVVTSPLRAHAPPAAPVIQRVAMRPNFA